MGNSLHVVEHQLLLRCSQRHGICSYPVTRMQHTSHNTPASFFNIHFNIISPSSQRPSKQSVYFRPFHQILFPTRQTSSAHLNLVFYLLVLLGQYSKSCKPLSKRLSARLANSFVLCPNIRLNTFFMNTPKYHN